MLRSFQEIWRRNRGKSEEKLGWTENFSSTSFDLLLDIFLEISFQMNADTETKKSNVVNSVDRKEIKNKTADRVEERQSFTRPSIRTKLEGDEVCPSDLLPETVIGWNKPHDIRNLILFEDKHVVVLYKPPAFLSQAEKEKPLDVEKPDTEESSTPLSPAERKRFDLMELVRSYFASTANTDGSGSSQFHELPFIGLIHRLDRPASGIIVYAKTYESLQRMNDMFQRRTEKGSKLVEKSYFAIVNGKLPEGKEQGVFVDYLRKTEGPKSLVINLNNTKNPEKRKKLEKCLNDFTIAKYQQHEEIMKEIQKIDKSLVIGKITYKSLDSVDMNEEKRSATKKTIEELPAKYQSLLEIKLETGRKHQIRSQLSFHGLPIVGDVKYKAPQRFSNTKDICLHSFHLSFYHPIFRKEKLSYSVLPPRIWKTRFPQAFTTTIEKLVSRGRR
jgi:23S rRNA pseudouridine1911/1915/1917 synthase